MVDVKFNIDHRGGGSLSVDGVDLSSITNGVTIRSKVGQLTEIQLDVPAVAIDGQMQVHLNRLRIAQKKDLVRTKEAPTVPGWYWWIDDGVQGRDAELVHLVNLDLVGENGLRIYRIGHDVETLDMFLDRNSGGEWVGPLEVPV